MANLKVSGSLIGIGVAGVFGLAVAGGSFFTTDATERHVVTTFGEVERVTEPGLHFKIPFAQAATPYSLALREFTVGPKSIASKGNQTLQDVVVKVQYTVPAGQVEWLHTNAPDYDLKIQTLATKIANEVIGTTDTTVLADTRRAVSAAMRTKLQEAVDGNGMGLSIQTVSLENFEWDPDFAKSIRENAQVKNEIVRLEAEERREEIAARKVVITAEGEANRRRAEAAGEADAARAAAEGERDAVKARAEGEAFRVSAEGEARAAAFEAEIAAFGSPDAYVNYVTAKQWNGDVPQIVSGDGGQGMLIDLRSAGAVAKPIPR